MRIRTIWITATIIALGLGGFGAWLFSLPAIQANTVAPPVPEVEYTKMLAALAPTTKERPLIAVIGLNDATETTDYLMPTGILRRADVAEVVLLATQPGPVQLYPALKVEPDATTAEFDAAHTRGADYVIVPAMSRDDDPTIMRWLQEQSRKGAKIIGICAGAKVVAAAGLLDGHKATTHWYYLDEMLNRSPSINYVSDRRMVADGNVATTTGVTASMPMMLSLIEAIAGQSRAKAVAADLGLVNWSAKHASDAFQLNRAFATTVMRNRAGFWQHEDLSVPLEQGMDEVSLALVADAWSRTYRSQAISTAPSNTPIVTANGLRILPDVTSARAANANVIAGLTSFAPAAALEESLERIRQRYGRNTEQVVAMQLEYPTKNQ